MQLDALGFRLLPLLNTQEKFATTWKVGMLNAAIATAELILTVAVAAGPPACPSPQRRLLVHCHEVWPRLSKGIWPVLFPDTNHCSTRREDTSGLAAAQQVATCSTRQQVLRADRRAPCSPGRKQSRLSMNRIQTLCIGKHRTPKLQPKQQGLCRLPTDGQAATCCNRCPSL